MKNPTYKWDAKYTRRKCWKRYHISRERNLRRAAALLGEPSYQCYMRFAFRKHWKTKKGLSKNTLRMLDILGIS